MKKILKSKIYKIAGFVLVALLLSGVFTPGQSQGQEAKIMQDNVKASWTTPYSEIRLPLDAQSVEVTISSLRFETKDGVPKQFLEKGDKIYYPDEDGEEDDAEVAEFRIGFDLAGKTLEQWDCDGWFFNDCELFQESVSGNPAGDFKILVPLSEDEDNDSIFVSAGGRNHGNSFQIQTLPLIRASGSDVDFPFLSPTNIKIIFDENITQQVNSGSATGGGGGTKNPDGDASVGNIVTGTVISLINTVLGAIFAIFRWVFWLLGNYVIMPILETTLSFQAGDLAGGVILEGWKFVRDIVNMLFILFLIVIGLGTILRIESYNYRKLLVNLIVMAALVNFSLVIARIVLQIADTIQFSFLPTATTSGHTDGIIRIRYLYHSMVTVQISSVVEGLLSFSLNAEGSMAALGSLIFQTILEIGVIMTFGAMAVFMLIRTVALWILLILSPLAYGLMVLPATSGIAKKWWSNFLKYAFFGAILGFFLRLTLVLYKNGLGIVPDHVRDKLLISPPQASTDVYDLLYKQMSNTGSNFDNALELMLIYVVILAFMWAGLMATRQIGILGADKIVNIAQKGIMSPFAGAGFLGKRFGGYVARRWNDITGSLLSPSEETRRGRFANKIPSTIRKAGYAALNPVNFARGWEERAKELSEISKGGATAGGREVAEQFLTSPVFRTASYGVKGWEKAKKSWGEGAHLKIPYREFSDRQDENRFMDDYLNMRKETLMRKAVEIEHMGGPEGSLRRRAIVKAAAGQGYLDDIMRMKTFAKKYAEKDGTFYSPEAINRFLTGYLGKDEQSLRFMAEDMEDLGRKTSHYEYMGHGYFDPSKNKFMSGYDEVGEIETGRYDDQGKEIKIKKLYDKWQGDYASGEFAKTSGRDRVRSAPHNFKSIRGLMKTVMVDGKERLEFIDGEELSANVVWGTADGHMSSAQAKMLSKIGTGDSRDIHHTQSRTPDILISSGIDPNTQEVIVNSEADAMNLKELWETNRDYAIGLMSYKLGQEARWGRENIRGIKVSVYDKDTDGNIIGKHASSVVIGHPGKGTPPIGENLVKEIDADKSSGLSDLGDNAEKAKSFVKNNVIKVYNGTISKGEFGKQLKAAIPSANPIAVDAFTDVVYEKTKKSLLDVYKPTKIFDNVNARLSKDKKSLTSDDRKNIKKMVEVGIAEAFNQTFDGSRLTKDKIYNSLKKARGGMSPDFQSKVIEKDLMEIASTLVPSI